MPSPLNIMQRMPRAPRPRASILLAFVLCPVLLGVSGYGFLEWFKLPADTRVLGFEEIFFLMCLVVIPLVIFIFLSLIAAQRLEYNRLSVSYQIRLDHLQKRLNEEENFLYTITDYNPESIAVFDKKNQYWFVNQSAAKQLKATVKDVLGKMPIKLLDPDRAVKLETRLNLVRASMQPLVTLDQITENGQVHFIQSHYEAMKPFGDLVGGVIVREEDVTSLLVERERRANMLKQVIGTLVAVVDRRDPYASGHSARVGHLARAIAEEMMLNEKNIEAAEIAGSLMNFGKVLVPRQILTKTSALTPDELQRVRDSILTSADILSIIDFVGPVVPTLRQVQERFDGTGVPNNLKGDQILITARVVTVANAYVALASPRAHRPSLDFRDAVQHMMKDNDKIYDKRVVTALANYIESHSNKLDWLTASKPN